MYFGPTFRAYRLLALPCSPVASYSTRFEPEEPKKQTEPEPDGTRMARGRGLWGLFTAAGAPHAVGFPPL